MPKQPCRMDVLSEAGLDALCRSHCLCYMPQSETFPAAWEKADHLYSAPHLQQLAASDLGQNGASFYL